MARADARINEHLAERLRAAAETADVGAAGSSSSGTLPGAVAGASERYPEEAEEAPAQSAGPARAGASPGDEDMSVSGEQVAPEDNTDDVDEEMGYLENILGRPLERGTERPEAADLVRALFAAGATPGEVRASVCEVYSPPRVMAAAARHPRVGVLPAGAFDVRPGPGGVPWDFAKPEHREEACLLYTSPSPRD
eukprot:12961489-Alexandrium_andersonii.AAC.1